MYRNTKIATCCYCGTRTALVLGRDRHELLCGQCGAPLHELKRLPVKPGEERAPVRAAPAPAGQVPPEVSGAALARKWGETSARRPRKVKKRKPLWQRALGEVADLIEDVFD